MITDYKKLNFLQEDMFQENNQIALPINKETFNKKYLNLLKKSVIIETFSLSGITNIIASKTNVKNIFLYSFNVDNLNDVQTKEFKILLKDFTLTINLPYIKDYHLFASILAKSIANPKIDWQIDTLVNTYKPWFMYNFDNKTLQKQEFWNSIDNVLY